MKYGLFIFLFLFLAKIHGHSQAISRIDVFGDINSSVTADAISVSDDGNSFTCSGNVTMTPLDPTDPDLKKPDCGGSTGYVCGVLSMYSTSGDITIFTCVGSSGRCVRVYNQ